MLATLTDQLPSGGKWIYEPKLDGVRALIYVSGGTAQIYSAVESFSIRPTPSWSRP